MLLNNQWVTEEIKEEIKKSTWRQMKMETHDLQSMGCSKRSSKREV